MKSEEGLAIKVQVRDAHFVENLKKHTDQIQSSGLFLPPSRGHQGFEGEEKSHQKKIFEILNESKQTSREVRAGKSHVEI